MRIEQIYEVVIFGEELPLYYRTDGSCIVIGRFGDRERELPVADVSVSFELFSRKTAEDVELISRLKTFLVLSMIFFCIWFSVMVTMLLL